MHINEIGAAQVKSLRPDQLIQLLNRLLHIEDSKLNLQSNIHVSENINAKDDGIDGIIKWDREPFQTPRFGSNYCGFQCKATTLTPEQCKAEVILKRRKSELPKLKPAIEDLALSNGCYILFITQPLTEKGITLRVKKIKEAFSSAGFDKFNNIRIYDATYISNWVNCNIATVNLVLSYNESSRRGFRIWDEWQASLQNADIKYETNVIIRGYLQNILQVISQNKPIRIIGQSGLGKTRLALESFRENLGFQMQVAYFEIGINGGIDTISDFIISNKTKDGILVVDACNEENHNALSSLINISNFKLITIDNAFETNANYWIKLNKNDQADIVNVIIDNLLGNSHSSTDKQFLKNLCEGFPWMAIRLCYEINEQRLSNFSEYLPETFRDKLIFGNTNPNDIEYKVIQACSVFSSFGFPFHENSEVISHSLSKLLEDQIDFIRQEILAEQISKNKFFEICQKYRTKGILERKGTLLQVKPAILAINLASKWLKETPHSKIIEVINHLKDDQLGLRLVERIRELDQDVIAIEIVKELWGPNSPFGTAEVLNTSWGSQLFRLVVDVNPVATTETLVDIYLRNTKEENTKVTEGRRNLVWALEKLCFRSETFLDASKVLLAFAVSENEQWANNATNQFIHLFSIYLAGTQADFNARIEVVNYAFNQVNPEFESLALKGINKGLSNYMLTRMLGAENQGSSLPLKEFEPSIHEIIEYRKYLFNLLNDRIYLNEENAQQARTILASSISSLIDLSQYELIDSVIEKQTKKFSISWREASNSLKWILAHNQNLSPTNRAKLESVLDKLSPTKLEDKLYAIVTMAEFGDVEKDTKGSYIDNSQIRAVKLADEIIDNNIDITENLPQLLQGEQRQTFNFGLQLGKRVNNKKEFIDKIYFVLTSMPPHERNIDLIGGFLNGANDDEISRYAYNMIRSIANSEHFLFYLVKFVNPKLEDFIDLISICRLNNLPISYFRNFNFGFSFKNLTVSEIHKLLNEIAIYSREGAWTALMLAGTICFHNEDNWEKYKGIIKEIIVSDNLLINNENVQFDFYHWKDSVNRLLEEKNDDAFAKLIATQIIEHCKVSLFASMSDRLLPTLEILISDYFTSTWNIIGGGLISDYNTYWSLKGILNSGFSKIEGILFSNKIDPNVMIEWIRANSEVAPRRIANFMPIDSIDNTKPIWHPISKLILDEYANQEGVLDEIHANFNTFSWSGSVIPYYVKAQEMVKVLLRHHNPQVDAWAKQTVKEFEIKIKQRKLEEEERGWV